ncbi:hypothetical protein AYO44_00120 [Planctomycetaceae bacterium SCGC AG-212-F19]|nr:hypothetical protein AYO44_00120 [Planctomycetaceae bacterium SCGC AG-212-F19]
MLHPTLSRRDLLQLSALGVLSAPASGWLSVLAARAAEQSEGKPKHKSCILLFMHGGPSHIDTFDPKPDNKSSEIKALNTAVTGIQVGEHLPKVGAMMKDVALLRGMSTSEGSHGRARYYMHTGYREGVGGVVHPSMGAIASAKLGKPDDALPNFVSISNVSYGSGYLGPFHAPLEVGDPAKGIENLKPVDSLASFDKRTSLLEEIEKGFLDRVQTASAQAHQATYQRAAQLMHSAKAKAFDLSAEPATLRDAYGRSNFGEGCLLARRLLEHGVAFVEVGLGSWDTHRDNAGRIKSLCGQLDPALATLLKDLKDRGMLNDTLVVWMGDFGRTPTVGKQGGRDHYPRAWTTALAGAGLNTGQTVGRTDKQGGTVEDRPTSAIDFMATVCSALGIDYNKNFYTRDGRPMRIVDKGEKVVSQLF